MAKYVNRNIANDLFGIVPRKQGINSKRKGDRNELEAARVFGEWAGGKFVRVPSSGGLRRNITSYTVGDIVPDCDLVFPFVIETKHLHTVYVTDTLRTNSIIYKLWLQVWQDTQRANDGRVPLLIVRQNNMDKGDYYVFFETTLYNWIRLYYKVEKISQGARIIDGVLCYITGMMFSELQKVDYLKFANYIESNYK